jgi:hypothetical protein
MNWLSFIGATAASWARDVQDASSSLQRAVAGETANVNAAAAATAAMMRRLRMIPLLPPTEQAYCVRQA